MAPVKTKPKETPAETPAPEIIDILAVYLGRTYNSGKLCACFMTLTDLKECTSPEEALITSAIFSNKSNQLPRMIGGIYNIRGRLDGTSLKSMIPGVHKWTGDKWPKASDVAFWESRDQAAVIAERAKTLEKSEEKRSAITALIEPLRMRYTATDAIGKLALEVLVLKKLRGM